MKFPQDINIRNIVILTCKIQVLYIFVAFTIAVENIMHFVFPFVLLVRVVVDNMWILRHRLELV
jgi:hypothetical protein